MQEKKPSLEVGRALQTKKLLATPVVLPKNWQDSEDQVKGQLLLVLWRRRPPEQQNLSRQGCCLQPLH